MSTMFDPIVEIVKREMVLFLLIDQSGSMYGTKIGAVNTAVREAIPELRDVGGSDASIKVAVLLFSNGCKWMYPEPIPIEDFQWDTIEADGMTDLGVALSELSSKMSKNSFLKSPSASVAPVIFLLSDGAPTDDYESGLQKLKENKWFKYAIKVAVAIGDDADLSVLERFTGTKEGVILTHTPEALKKMIRFLTVTSSKIGSKSQVIVDGEAQTKQLVLNQDIQDYLIDNPDIDQSSEDDWD